MMGRFKKYESYQPTNINWIGELPSTWKLSRLGSVFEERRLKVSDKEFPPLSVTKNGVVPQLETAAKTNDGDNRKGVFKGDFVINSRSDRKGSSGLAKQNGSVSLINTVLKPVNIFPQFSEYLLKSYSFIEEFYRNGHGIVDDLWTTKYSEMKGIMIPLPSKSEQKTIATFLNHKTAQIAHYIQLKEKTIALLEERKAAIINQAVTKGLNPDAPMKDSGVEWLGEIPEGWEVKKLFWLSEIFNGTTPSRINSDFWENGTIPWLASGKVNDYFVEEPSELITLKALEKCSLAIVPKSSIIMGMIGQGKTRGTVAYLNIDACINQNLAAIVPKKAVNSMFLFYYLQSIYKPIREFARGGNQEALNCQIISSLKILLPPLREQRKIVGFLDQQMGMIKEAINQIEKEITLIKEYRESLISAAVTGKIDVRQYQPTASEYAAADNY